MIEKLHRVLNGEVWEELKLNFAPAEAPMIEPVRERYTPVLDQILASPVVQEAVARTKTIDARRQHAIREVERLVGTSLSRHQVTIYAEAYRLLSEGQFHAYCSHVIGEYHAGDCTLRQLLLRGALRASFSSKSALLHFAMTGATGSGKNDLIENVAKILPIKNVILYSSITPQVLYYEMRVPVPGVKNGWLAQMSSPSVRWRIWMEVLISQLNSSA